VAMPQQFVGCRRDELSQGKGEAPMPSPDGWASRKQQNIVQPNHAIFALLPASQPSPVGHVKYCTGVYVGNVMRNTGVMSPKCLETG
jgi:hypothetical protein